jgi:2,3-diketo-5-methylthio-1-phosphopentane phosphatase
MPESPGPLDPSRVQIYSDFDGTITSRDTLIFLAENLGGGRPMIEAIGRLIREGKISLREGIAAEMRSIRAPFSEAVALLRERIEIDPGFEPFARWCEAQGIPLMILSAGFEQIIELFIPSADFPRLDVRANQLRPDERIGWQCDFRDQTAFGHDKAQAVNEAHRAGAHVIFIGDGLSDRAPAEVADEVFAKHDLALYCQSRGINCHEFEHFDEIFHQLSARLR